MQKITVYSKHYCPYCRAAKALLREHGLDFEEIEVGENPDLLARMRALSGRRTVPQIFFDADHIGGHDDLVAWFRGRDASVAA